MLAVVVKIWGEQPTVNIARSPRHRAWILEGRPAHMNKGKQPGRGRSKPLRRGDQTKAMIADGIMGRVHGSRRDPWKDKILVERLIKPSILPRLRARRRQHFGSGRADEYSDSGYGELRGDVLARFHGLVLPRSKGFGDQQPLERSWATSSVTVIGRCFVVQELANPQEILEESSDERVVLALYEALSARDVDTVHKLLASDLEWWFHGPPSHQFMMRLLTGSATSSATQSFEFAPLSIAAFGSTVLVEGCDHARSISWVHAWTVTHGIITQVREYFNTSLTVTRFVNTDKSSPSDFSSSRITSLHCPSVWESSLSNRVGKSVPGLVLAI
ncbi:senescence associated gene 20 [Actinidia rufa]|uniref:Senescence associated gene 20 n=2 Tax=Actinidia TaxID=3624 RepID=A0A7J0E6T6_9ERIC|nr:senescence associated gene 20 [Actinidia rufa]